jgi:hypothetical protein
MGNFQGTYLRPGNSWDLKNCRKKLRETLREDIHYFSKQCNEHLDIIDTDMIMTFISGTTMSLSTMRLGVTSHGQHVNCSTSRLATPLEKRSFEPTSA